MSVLHVAGIFYEQEVSMKKKLMTVITACATAGILLAPVSAEAAQVQIGKGYLVVSSGLSGECLSWQILSNPWCLPEAPGTDCPDTETPDNSQTPGTDTEIPDTGEAKPDVPDTETSDTGAEKPDAPDTENPDTGVAKPDAPDTENPDTTGQKSFAEQVADLVNAERAKEGLSPLKLDETVAAAALVRAKETEISFSHTRPDGKSFSTALTEQGVNFRGAGENIAWGQKSPEAVMEAWMNSPGHRANILNEKFTTIGVGYYQNSSGTNYWTQLFTY